MAAADSRMAIFPWSAPGRDERNNIGRGRLRRFRRAPRSVCFRQTTATVSGQSRSSSRFSSGATSPNTAISVRIECGIPAAGVMPEKYNIPATVPVTSADRTPEKIFISVSEQKGTDIVCIRKNPPTLLKFVPGADTSRF